MNKPLTIAAVLGGMAFFLSRKAKGQVSPIAPIPPVLPPDEPKTTDPIHPKNMAKNYKPVVYKPVDANQGGSIVQLDIPDESTWSELTVDGKRYLVAPRAIGPLRIGEAVKLAAMYGWTVPTRTISDAIWAAADLKVNPRPMAHDGTPKTMFSADTISRHKALVEAQIGGRPFKLLAGDHKDIVVEHGKAGIYGWHVAEGDAVKLGIPTYAPVTKGLGARIVQPWPSPHDDSWGDYSQYLHPVREIG